MIGAENYINLSWIDVTVLVFLSLSMVRGYTLGIIRQVCSLVGLIMGVLFAEQFVQPIKSVLVQALHLPVPIAKPVAYIAGFIVIYLSFLILGRMLRQLIHGVRLGSINRLLGACFSAIKWMMFLSLCILLLESVDKKERLMTKQTKDKSYSYQFVKSIFPQAMSILEEKIPLRDEATSDREE